MKININSAIKNPRRQFDFDFRFIPQAELLNNSLAYFCKEAVFSGIYYYLNDNILVKGNISYGIIYPCDRCLKSVQYNKDIVFDEVFCRQAQSNNDYTYSGTAIDLSKPAADYIILDMPAGVLCGKGCKGLCAVCGRNLNEGSCKCVAESVNNENPFSILKKK